MNPQFIDTLVERPAPPAGRPAWVRAQPAARRQVPGGGAGPAAHHAGAEEEEQRRVGLALRADPPLQEDGWHQLGECEHWQGKGRKEVVKQESLHKISDFPFLQNARYCYPPSQNWQFWAENAYSQTEDTTELHNHSPVQVAGSICCPSAGSMDGSPPGLGFTPSSASVLPRLQCSSSSFGVTPSSASVLPWLQCSSSSFGVTPSSAAVLPRLQCSSSGYGFIPSSASVLPRLRSSLNIQEEEE